MGDHPAPILAGVFTGCCQRVEEAVQGGLVATGRGAHQAPGVVVDDDGEVLVALLVGDLVDADLPQPGELIDRGGGVGPVAGDDRSDGAPRDPHQLTRRGLRGLRRQPRNLLIERERMPGPVARPRHPGDDDAVIPAADPRGVGFEEHLNLTEVQAPPPSASLAPVIES